MLKLPPPEEIVDRLTRSGVELPDGPVAVGAYGDSAEQSQRLIDLIRTGSKRAGTGLLWAYQHDGDPVPSPGTIEVVIDDRNDPVLVTRVTSVEIVPFDRVSAAYAAVEGEGDGSLEYWCAGHWKFFSRECVRIGRRPSTDMPVVCSIFELLRIL